MGVQERGAQGSGGVLHLSQGHLILLSMTKFKQREPGVRHCPTPTAFSWTR